MLYLFNLLFIMFVTFSAFASEELLNIKNIVVSTSAKTASMAKDEAMDIAPIVAFRQEYPNCSEEFISKNRENISRALREFEIVKETVSPAHYRGIMNLSFSAAAIDRILNKTDVKIITTVSIPEMSQKTLIIPLFRHFGKVYAWDDNPWLKAWQDKNHEAAEKNYVIPTGDLEDMKITNFNMLLAGSDKFIPVMQKYDTDKVLILMAEVKSDRRNHEYKLSIFRKEISTTNNSSYLNKFTEIVQDNDSFFFTEAVGQVLNTKFDKLFDFDNLTIQANDLLEFEAFIFTGDYNKLSKILSSLEAAPKMKSSKIMDFSSNYVMLNITTTAENVHEVKAILNANSVQLTEANGVFVLNN